MVRSWLYVVACQHGSWAGRERATPAVRGGSEPSKAGEEQRNAAGITPNGHEGHKGSSGPQWGARGAAAAMGRGVASGRHGGSTITGMAPLYVFMCPPHDIRRAPGAGLRTQPQGALDVLPIQRGKLALVGSDFAAQVMGVRRQGGFGCGWGTPDRRRLGDLVQARLQRQDPLLEPRLLFRRQPCPPVGFLSALSPDGLPRFPVR